MKIFYCPYYIPYCKFLLIFTPWLYTSLRTFAPPLKHMLIPVYYMPFASISAFSSFVNHSLHLQASHSGFTMFILISDLLKKKFLLTFIWSIVIMYPSLFDPLWSCTPVTLNDLSMSAIQSGAAYFWLSKLLAQLLASMSFSKCSSPIYSM
jgi:hypothetical protein